MYPRHRLEALTDGVFAVAMTILILDVRIPEEAHVADNRALLSALAALWPKLFPYALSFLVLGSNWLAHTKIRNSHEHLGKAFAFWWLAYLLLATGIPFSTTVVGRFPHVPAAIWVYAGNLGVLAAVSYRLTVLQTPVQDDPHVYDRKVSQVLLAVSAVLAILISVVSPRAALWAFLLNAFATPLRDRLWRRDHTPD